MSLAVFTTLILCFNCAISQTSTTNSNNFQVRYKWSYLNYTWPSYSEYQTAIDAKKYIPENNAIVGIKFYKDKLYLALLRARPGTPVTLGFIKTNSDELNPLITPLPSWSMNVQKDCSTLQSVQSMEIDRKGIMWVLDGTRINSFTSCPAKLVLLDLNNGGKLIHSHIFDNETALGKGGFVNDIVLEERFGGYAYMTDTSDIDPGLIVYSKSKNKSWKLRHASMFAETNINPYSLDGINIGGLKPIDGIALSPLPKNNEDERLIFYTALHGLTLYAVSDKILRDEENLAHGLWRKKIITIGKRTSPSDGLIIDNQGNLFYGLLDRSSIGKWNINEPFETAKEIFIDTEKLIWPDSFAMDDDGKLYILANGIFKYFNPNFNLHLDDKIKFRIFFLETGNKNYMYSAT